LLAALLTCDNVFSVSWGSRNGVICASTKAALVETGTGSFGATYYHDFSASIDPKKGISSFNITVSDGSKTVNYVNGGSGYPIQDSVVWMPAETSVLSTGVSVSAAVSS
jgi:hypothetical protein